MRIAVALLLLATALAGCGSSDSQDSDGDGIYDRQERGGWTVTVDLVDRRIERRVFSDPYNHDTDGDGLPDLDEFRWYPPLDPANNDTDGDGLSDCQEAIHTVLAQCEDPDYREDLDGGYGTDPSKADSDPGVSKYVVETLGFTDETGTLAGNPPTWGDGIPDGEELAGYNIELPSGATRFVKTDPLNGDSDGDNLDDGEERYLYGSDPLNPDTDGDTCIDGRDPFPEADERYQLELKTFTLLRDADGGTGGADLQLGITFVENKREAPAGDGSVRVNVGVPKDISGLSGASVRPPACNYSPSDPWFLIQVQAVDVDGTAAKVLDIESRTSIDPESNLVPSVWWNARDGLFSWAGRNGPTFEGPAVFQGLDGELELDAAVRLP